MCHDLVYVPPPLSFQNSDTMQIELKMYVGWDSQNLSKSRFLVGDIDYKDAIMSVMGQSMPDPQ